MDLIYLMECETFELNIASENIHSTATCMCMEGNWLKVGFSVDFFFKGKHTTVTSQFIAQNLNS